MRRATTRRGVPALRALALLLALLASPAFAGTIVLDFEEEPLGLRGDSFTSVECGCVVFDGFGGEPPAPLEIDTFDGSRELRVGREGGHLVMELMIAVSGLSLEFAAPNDSESGADPVVLIGLAGGQVVDWDAAISDRDDVIDQTLAIFGSFEEVYFEGTQLGELQPADPVIDRVTLFTVPEPAALALLLAAAGARAARLRSSIPLRRLRAHPRRSHTPLPRGSESSRSGW